ncbi:Sensor histidine kinase YpdA [compost metagenome]
MKRSLKVSMLLLLLLAFSGSVQAQSAPASIESSKKALPKAKSMGTIANEAEKDISSDNSQQQADGYMSMGDVLFSQGKYNEAERYFEKAAVLLKNNDREYSAAKRKVAKAQEMQAKLNQAAQNYDLAGKGSNTNLNRQLNYNDANRLRTTNYKYQQQLSQDNVSLLQKTKDKQVDVQQEMSDAYTQLAASQNNVEDSKAAINSLTNAVKQQDKPNAGTEAAAEQLSRQLVQQNKVEDAIALNKSLVKNTDAQTQSKLKVAAYTQLGTLYAQAGNEVLAEENLRKAYDTAKSVHNTQAGKNALKHLLQFYIQNNQSGKAQSVMLQFLDDMDELLLKDSALMDKKAVELSAQKIKQLENEKELQKEIIVQSRRSNYLLLAIVVVILLFLGLMLRAYYAIMRKNKQIRLQSLRREMNPHFVFNSLNSVNQFIAEHDDRKANAYLNAYSRLMRTVMEHSSHDFVPLSVELDHLQKYLSLEYQRFSSQFEYHINVADDIEPHDIMIPNMLLQPFLENAIWHGLRYKTDKGQLWLNIRQAGNMIYMTVTDDGIGIEQSLALKTENQKAYKSLGMQNTKERIELLNSLYKTRINYQLKDLSSEGKNGTTVTLTLPIQRKNDEDTDH